MVQAATYQPLVLADTAQLARPDWLEYRRKGIGGSDAAAVLGISPFRTARDLSYDKLGVITADDRENSWRWGTCWSPSWPAFSQRKQA